MLEGKSERLEFQKISSSPHRKNWSEQGQKKEMLKKGEQREMNNQKRDEWKDDEKWSFM